MTSLPLKAEYPIELNSFDDVYLVSKFDVSSFSVTGDKDFKTSHFTDFEHFKIGNYSANFGQVKIDPFESFLLTLDRLQLFYCIWVRHALKMDSNLRLIKIQEPCASDCSMSHFQ